MPKQFKKYLRFDGGLNTNADPRDIGEHELSDIKNMMVDHVGKIRTIGQLGTPTGITATEDNTISKGFGLFVFSSDYDMPTNGGISGTADNGSGKARFTTIGSHGLSTDDKILHWDFSLATYNGWKEITVIDATHYDTSDAYSLNQSGKYVEVSEANNSAEDYVVLADTGSSDISIMPVSDDFFAKGMIDLGSTAGAKAVFYFIDGALRACDSNFGANNVVKWFGYIKHPHVGQYPSYEKLYSSWYEKNAAITPPTRGIAGYQGIYGQATNDANSTISNLRSQTATAFSDLDSELDDGVYIADNLTDAEARIISARVDGDDITTENLSGTWQNDWYLIFPPAGTGFNLLVEPTGADGTWDAVDLEFASTFIYMGNQESLLYAMDGNVSVSADNKLGINVTMVTPFDPRIIGGRIYYREEGTDDDWKLIVDIDLMEGIKSSIDSSWIGWTIISATGSGDAPSNRYIRGTNNAAIGSPYASFNHVDPPVLSYEAITGVNQSEGSIEAQFKCATALNRRAWIANVKAKDKYGNDVLFGDRVMFSPVNNFDIFPNSYYLTITPNDGDEFIALQGYADRLFAFKKRKLYVINVSSGNNENWFLESEHPYMGVKLPSATTTTEFGIAWVNKNGCFFFDGNKILNLLEVKELRSISTSDWESFITDDSIIGYNPSTRQIIVVSDADATAGNIYLFDFPTKSWIKGDKFSQAASGAYTNFAVLDNELLIGKYTA